MKIPLDQIKIGPDRRALVETQVQELVRTFSSVGQLHPITLRPDFTLISGLHRMEAARRLGWTEIEGNVRDLDELHARLAEIDENIVRAGLSRLEMEDALAQRKEIYEALNPSTIARNRPGHVNNHGSSANLAGEQRVKPFAEDSAEKLGMSARAVQRHVWLSENTTPEAKAILKSSERGRKITQEEHTKLARLQPEQQKEAAQRYVAGEINSMDEYIHGGKKLRLMDSASNVALNPHYADPDFFMMVFEMIYSRTINDVKDLHVNLAPSFPAITEEMFSKVNQMCKDLCAIFKNLAEDIRRSGD